MSAGWSFKPQRVKRTDTHQSLHTLAPACERGAMCRNLRFWEVIAKVSKNVRTLVKMLISFSRRNVDVRK